MKDGAECRNIVSDINGKKRVLFQIRGHLQSTTIATKQAYVDMSLVYRGTQSQAQYGEIESTSIVCGTTSGAKLGKLR